MVFTAMLIALIFASTPTPLLSSSAAAAKPNCADRCGEIAIPYPFGTTPECYQHYSFFVTCNHTFTPPKLFMQNSSVEITDINVDGQLKVLQLITKDCYARNGTSILKSSPLIELPHYFTVNNTANKFMVVGCDAIGVVNGKRLSRDYALGCTAQCEASDDLRLREGSCNGIGCCQTTVAEDVWRLNILLTTYSNYSDVWDINNCGYGFVVEEKAFKFSIENLNALKEVERLPMVVDWAIGNGTCEEGEKNSATFACKSPISACYKPETGYGYRCRCLDGYQGNPYLQDGCQGL